MAEFDGHGGIVETLQVAASVATRNRTRRLLEHSEPSQFVCDHLVQYRWSPQQIAAMLRDMHPDDVCRWPEVRNGAYPRVIFAKAIDEWCLQAW
jgi:hypothetical protein